MTQVYEIAAKISLTNGVSSVLGVIAKDALKLGGIFGNLEKSAGRLNKAIVGGLSVAGGIELLKVSRALVENGGELVKQQTLLKNLNFDNRQITEATLSAQRASTQVIGTNIAGNVKAIRELVGIMPNIHEAENVLPDLLKAAAVLHSLKGTPIEGSTQTLAKAVELRGGGINPVTKELDPEQFKKELLAAQTAIIASGGLVDQNQLLNLMKQAGPMARMSDADTFYKGILSAAMDMGGNRAGTALTALGRQLLGGKMGFQTAEDMADIGLLKKGSYHKSGGGARVDPGGLVGEDILKSGGVQAWMNAVLLPSLKSHGFTSDASVMQEMYRVFGTETARRLASLFIQNKAQVAKDAELYDAAKKQGAYDNIAKGDLKANVENFSEALNSLMQTLGAGLVGPAISGLHGLADGVNYLTGMLSQHPDIAKGMGFGTVGAGLAATGFGAYKLIDAFRGGFGLTTAAAELTGAAAALTGAAGKLGGASVAGDVAKLGATAAGGSLLAGTVFGAGAAAIGLAGGAAAGKMNMPMVDEFGRVVGSWGGRDEGYNPAKLGGGLNNAIRGSAPILDDTKFSAGNMKVATDWLTNLANAAKGIPGPMEGATGAIQSFIGALGGLIQKLGESAAAADGMPVPGKQSAADVGRKLSALNRYPTSIGSASTRTAWMGPGLLSRPT